MIYWAKIRDDELIDISLTKFLDDDIENIETTEYFFNLYISDKNKVAYIGGEIVENPEYINFVKEAKYNEANTGAKAYIDNGRALYELTPTRHIEATDGNIGKFSAYALGYVTGQITGNVTWTTKEDEVIELNQKDVQQILTGLGFIQAQVWTVKFPYYKNLIEQAQTVAEVEAIVIDYDSEVFND